MPLPLAAFAVPAGTALMQLLMSFFRYSIIQWVVKAGIFSLVSFGAYFLAASIIPDWFSLETLRAQITSFSPAVAYFLHVISFYYGASMMFAAFIGAWVFKKIPGWVWLGPLYRLAN